MIAADTSSLVAYFEGASGRDCDLIDIALDMKQLILPPLVLTEILSDSKLPQEMRKVLQSIPLMTVGQDYWVRAGELRAKILSKGLKSRLADALIAQLCLDHDIALISRDRDFRHYKKHCDLVLE